MDYNDAKFLDSILIDLSQGLDVNNQSGSDKFLKFLIEKKLIIGEITNYGIVLNPRISYDGLLHIKSGGFTAIVQKEKLEEFDKKLERQNKIWAIRNAKGSLIISLIALLLSIIAIFK